MECLILIILLAIFWPVLLRLLLIGLGILSCIGIGVVCLLGELFGGKK